MAQSLEEKFEQYKINNEEYIVLHSGLSKFKSMRVFLIGDEEENKTFTYDIIIPKNEKLTTKGKKQQAILKIKSDLGVLNKEEKDEIQQDLGVQMDFLSNPLFYIDADTLLVDLNFKHYLHTAFNSVLTSEGKIISSFQEIDDESEEIFVASLDEDEDTTTAVKQIKTILSAKKSPYIFYTTYRNVLDLNTIPLKLENFAETNEFIEGSKGDLPQNSKIIPIKYKELQKEEGVLAKGNIKFAKFLNKKPLRSKASNMSEPLLPALPQRYVIDKQTFKGTPLRHVFKY